MIVEGWRDYLPDRDVWIAPAAFLLLVIILLVLILMFWLVGAVSNYRAYPSFAAFEQEVEQALPPDTDKKTVLEFLDRHQVSHGEISLISAAGKEGLARDVVLFRETQLKAKLSEIEYFVQGNRTIAEWRSWTTCWAQMKFYFDRNGKLAGARVHKICDGP